MEPTAPAWVSWYRRARARPRNRIAVYTFSRDDPTTLIRLNSMLGAPPPPPGPQPPPPPGERWRAHYAPEPDAWQAPVMPVAIKRHYQYEPISLVLSGRAGTPPPGAVGARAGAGAGGWGGPALGWAAGTALLALLVLLVHSAEKCLDKKLFKHRNRISTNIQRDPESIPSDITISSNVDLPPPYSECANSVASVGTTSVASVGTTSVASVGATSMDSEGANKPRVEDPPPPYSACYVTYCNPKDGIPSVHFYSRRRPDEAGASQTETDHRGDAELVFHNGRILERVERKETNDVPSDVSNSSNNSTQ